jgi:hypothetical protein
MISGHVEDLCGKVGLYIQIQATGTVKTRRDIYLNNINTF